MWYFPKQQAAGILPNSFPPPSFMWEGDYDFVTVCTLHLKGDILRGKHMASVCSTLAAFQTTCKGHVYRISSETVFLGI